MANPTASQRDLYRGRYSSFSLDKDTKIIKFLSASQKVQENLGYQSKTIQNRDERCGMSFKGMLTAVVFGITAFLHSGDSSENKPFVVGSLLGRVGNRMFVVAMATAVAWDNGAEPCFPEFSRSSDEFLHIFFRCKTTLPAAPMKPEWSFCPSDISRSRFIQTCEFPGIAKNEMYFSRYRNRLLRLFKPQREDLKYYRDEIQIYLGRSQERQRSSSMLSR